MPLVGPFFYGPNPGPCSYRSLGVSPSYTVTYTYQADQVQSEQETVDGQQTPRRESSYVSDPAGEIVSATSTGDQSETFEYGADSLTDTLFVSGAQQSQVRYTLSARGYPISAAVIVANKVGATVSYRYDHCRLQTRTTMDLNNTVTGQYDYSYDSAGRLVTRVAGDGSGETYDYSCW
jgi:YD repeat-containing protein